MNLEFDLKHIWHPFTQMAHHHEGYLPLTPIVRARGVYLYDAQDRPILDGISSWWTCNIGHNHPKVIQAIARQAEKLDHVMFAGFTHEPAIMLSQRLLELMPNTLRHIFYSDDGSTAVECALKIAAQYWHNQGHPQRNAFVAFSRAYHGDTLGAMSLGDTHEFHHSFSSLFFPVHRLTLPSFALPHQIHHVQEASFLENLRSFLQKNHSTLAGLFVEPLVMGAGGMVMYPPHLLTEMIRLAHDYDLLVIFDEVMTGFGRTGTCFAFEQTPEKPDLICLSKGLTGGSLPLAATMVSEKIYNAFLDKTFSHTKTFFHGHSYTANPIACAASAAALSVLLEEDLLGHLASLQPLFEKWHQHFSTLDLPIHPPRYLGGIFALNVTPNTKKAEPFPYVIFKSALKRGALIRPIGNTAYLMPPLCISPAELDRLFGILDESLKSYFT